MALQVFFGSSGWPLRANRFRRTTFSSRLGALTMIVGFNSMHSWCAFFDQHCSSHSGSEWDMSRSPSNHRIFVPQLHYPWVDSFFPFFLLLILMGSSSPGVHRRLIRQGYDCCIPWTAYLAVVCQGIFRSFGWTNPTLHDSVQYLRAAETTD